LGSNYAKYLDLSGRKRWEGDEGKQGRKDRKKRDGKISTFLKFLDPTMHFVFAFMSHLL